MEVPCGNGIDFIGLKAAAGGSLREWNVKPILIRGGRKNLKIVSATSRRSIRPLHYSIPVGNLYKQLQMEVPCGNGIDFIGLKAAAGGSLREWNVKPILIRGGRKNLKIVSATSRRSIRPLHYSIPEEKL